eukprot:15483920-Alexandrium_andersonii.AAC.1
MSAFATHAQAQVTTNMSAFVYAPRKRQYSFVVWSAQFSTFGRTPTANEAHSCLEPTYHTTP